MPESHTMNDYVYYKPTPKGKEIVEKIYEEALGRKRQLEYYSGEWVKDQLWRVFQYFGRHCYNGADDILIAELTFDDPLKEK